jgi:hypothetical protein
MSALDDLAFGLRSRLTWSLPAFKRVVGREQVEAALDAKARARLAELERRFDLSAWGTCCSLPEWRESLYVLDVLATHLPPGLPEGRGLDVGAKNGCTLPGLVTATGRPFDAVELDAHRRYLWGSTRRVYGEALARRFEGSRFIGGSVADQPGPWAVVTWFLPFLTPEPLAAWGLPSRFLAPEALLRHVLGSVVPGGVVLIVNQGEEEAALQQRLLEQVGARFTSLGRIDCALSPFRLARFGLLVRNK